MPSAARPQILTSVLFLVKIFGRMGTDEVGQKMRWFLSRALGIIVTNG